MESDLKDGLDYYRETKKTRAWDPSVSDVDPLSMVFVVDSTSNDEMPALTESAVLVSCCRSMFSLLSRCGDDEDSDDGIDARVKRWTDGRIIKLVKHANQGKIRKIISESDDDFAMSVYDGRKDSDADVQLMMDARVTSVCFKPMTVGEQSHSLKRARLAGLDLEDDLNAVDWYSKIDVKRSYLKIVLASDLGMSTGKKIAQAMHAVQVALERLSDDDYAMWTNVVNDGAWPQVMFVDGVPDENDTVVIYDAGFTEIPADSLTASAHLVRPWHE